MDKEPNPRPTQRGRSAVTRERPVPPSARPRAPRPQSGSSSERLRQRQAAPEPRQRQSATEPRQTRQTTPEPSARRRPTQQEEAPRRHADARQEEDPRLRRPKPQGDAASRESRRGSLPPAEDRGQAPRRKAAPKPEPRPKARKKKPHRVYNTNFGFKFAVMLAVVAVIVLGMIIFFKVKHIRVVLPEEGSYYSQEEIIAASGINIDDNLLSLSKATVASRIHAELPYVNEIQVKKQLPGTVIITVSEFEVSYGIQDETGAWWLMTREGRILEPADEQSVKGHLTVTGMPITAPQVGDYVKPAAAEGGDMSEIASKRSAALAVLPALEGMPYAKKLQSVDVSTSYDIVLWYGTQFEIRLGNTENLSYKLQYLQGVLEELGRDKSGTIDLSFTEDNSAHFLPFG